MRWSLKVNYLLGLLLQYFCSLKQSIKISLKQNVFPAFFQGLVSLKEYSFKVKVNNLSVNLSDI